MFFGGLAFALAPLLGRAGSAGVAGLVDGRRCGSRTAWTSAARSLLLSPFHWTVRPHPARRHLRLAVARARGARRRRLPGDRRRAVHAPRPRRHGRPLAARACRRRSSASAGPVEPGVRRPAAAGALLGDRPRPDRASLFASLVGSLADQISERLEPHRAPSPRSSRASTSRRPAAGSSSTRSCSSSRPASRAATFVSKWASDETDGRLEMVLATPMARARWVVAGGVAALLAVVVMTVLFAAGRRARRGGRAASPPATRCVGCAALGLVRRRDRRRRRRGRRPVADVAGGRDRRARRGGHVPDRPRSRRRSTCRTGSTSSP